jgi:hypothetical protein
MNTPSYPRPALACHTERLYQETGDGRDITYLEFSTFVSSLCSPIPFVAPFFSVLHHGDYVHGCFREQVSEILSVEILHREADDKVLGRASRRDCSSSSTTAYIDRSGVSDNIMNDINSGHGDAAA